jgi:probable rRNA maturation factor
VDPDSNLRVTVRDGRGRPIRDEGLARWLSAVAPARVRGEVSVALVSDRKVRELNKRYRRKDSPTDVLSFASKPEPRAPSPELRASSLEPRAPSPEPRFLGDIVIATGVAKRQARARRHTYRTELRVLALHGLLHLLGYDHERNGDDGAMARIEARLRRKGGLQEGLIGREPERAPAARAGRSTGK